MTKKRISNPRTGTGDSGRSWLVSGYRIRKSSSICTLQNELQDLRDKLQLFTLALTRHHQLPAWKKTLIRLMQAIRIPNKLIEFVKEDQFDVENELLGELMLIDKIVNEVINNISASAYFKFENQKYEINRAFLLLMTSQIKELSETFISCDEFFVPDEVVTLTGSMVTTQVRRVENIFWIAVEDVYEQHDKHDFDPRDNEVITSTAQFVNAFSDFMFMLTVLIHDTLGYERQYWQNKEEE